MQNSTSGGSSETETNEFMVMPSGAPPAVAAVTMTTPVGSWAQGGAKFAAGGDVRIIALY